MSSPIDRGESKVEDMGRTRTKLMGYADKLEDELEKKD